MMVDGRLDATMSHRPQMGKNRNSFLILSPGWQRWLLVVMVFVLSGCEFPFGSSAPGTSGEKPLATASPSGSNGAGAGQFGANAGSAYPAPAYPAAAYPSPNDLNTYPGAAYPNATYPGLSSPAPAYPAPAPPAAYPSTSDLDAYPDAAYPGAESSSGQPGTYPDAAAPSAYPASDAASTQETVPDQTYPASQVDATLQPTSTATQTFGVINTNTPTPSLTASSTGQPTSTTPSQSAATATIPAYPYPDSPVYDPYPGMTTASPSPGGQDAYPYPGSTDTSPYPMGTVTASPPSADLLTPTASLTPGPSPTPTATPTPTFTPSPTATRTPIPLPPWVRSKLRASDPTKVKLASGKPQLVMFFTFWSGASQAIAPLIQGLEDRYKTRINFIYLDVDDPRTASLRKHLGYKLQPHFFLLDANGRVLSNWKGYVKISELVLALDAALK